jgi:hypothetical protein
MSSLRERLLAVPAFTAFPGVDAIDAAVLDLHRTFGPVTRLDEVGRSREGAPLRMLSVGTGDRHAQVIGMPHPNEPTGALGALQLARLLATDAGLRSELGLTWHFVACADPDGTRLNEAWFSGPYTFESYASQLYRPPFEEQFEWTFHRADLAEPGLPSLPESEAVMAVIDTLRPELVVSLHNAEHGGAYAYVTDKAPDLLGGMRVVRTVTGIPLELGEPDSVADVLGPGVFHVPVNLGGGALLCSTDYAGRYGAFGITSEPPLWVDPRADDDRPASADPTGVFERRRADLRRRHRGWLTTIDAEIGLHTARGRAIRSDSQHLASDWPLHRLSSVAEAAAWERAVDLERRRAAGHVVGLLRQERDTEDNPRLRAVLADAEATLAAWTESDQPTPRFVGLDGAVTCHVGVTLAAAAGLA